MKSKSHIFFLIFVTQLLTCCQAKKPQKEIIDTGKEIQVETIAPIDTLKVYEQSEVDTKAVFPMSNAQLLEFYTKNINYPDIKPITGRGEMDLIIDEDGYVKDVLIIKGLHPELDKEFVRIMKLLPRFTQPGKVKGKPVRCKYRLPISARAF